MGDDKLCGLSVLMTADTIGGVFSYALTLASELTRRGAVVHLATMGDALRAGQRAEAEAIPELVVHESVYSLEWMSDPWEDVARAGEWLLEVERAAAPDVVHLNEYAHGAAGLRNPVVIVGHSCVLSWWEAVLHESAPASLDRYRVEVSGGLATADAVVAPTHAMMRSLEEHYPLPALRSVVPNGVAVSQQPQQVPRQR
jgi:hypothetical protein